ncbi:MAG: hypothetical protein PHX61_12775 [Alphaproteobacteria bacterium]|nr:hypothetical protein [Alphaproteobacteria bacterium]
MKITIEGYEDGPVVIEDVEQFMLFADTGEASDGIGCVDQQFAGYVVALAQELFRQKLIED